MGPIYVSQTDMDHTVLVHYCTKCTPFIQLDKYTLPHIFAVCTRSISHAEYKLRKLQSALCESIVFTTCFLSLGSPSSFLLFFSASLTFSFPCDPEFLQCFYFLLSPIFSLSLLGLADLHISWSMSHCHLIVPFYIF